MDKIVESRDRGMDRIFREAPIVIVALAQESTTPGIPGGFNKDGFLSGCEGKMFGAVEFKRCS